MLMDIPDIKLFPPIMDVCPRRNICGWEVTKLPGLLFRAVKDGVTVRYYFVTKEWVVNFDADSSQHEYDNAFEAKQIIRSYLNGNSMDRNNA